MVAETEAFRAVVLEVDVGEVVFGVVAGAVTLGVDGAVTFFSSYFFFYSSFFA